MKSRNWLGLATTVAIALACATTSPAAQPPRAAAPTVHDGSHDFDFNTGSWKTHLTRRLHPFSGTDEFIELNGTVEVRDVWGGAAHLEEIEADGPKGHWRGLSLFLYNPTAHQWSQNFVNATSGVLVSGLIGSFAQGRGELFQQDTLEGRTILVRGVWSAITRDSHRYEESYSADGGKTWEVQLTADKTRAAPHRAP